MMQVESNGFKQCMDSSTRRLGACPLEIMFQRNSLSTLIDFCFTCDSTSTRHIREIAIVCKIILSSLFVKHYINEC